MRTAHIRVTLWRWEFKSDVLSDGRWNPRLVIVDYNRAKIKAGCYGTETHLAWTQSAAWRNPWSLHVIIMWKQSRTWWKRQSAVTARSLVASKYFTVKCAGVTLVPVGQRTSRLHQCCLNADPTSQTLDHQHWDNIDTACETPNIGPALDEWVHRTVIDKTSLLMCLNRGWDPNSHVLYCAIILHC